MALGISKKLEFLDSQPRLKALFLLLFRADDFLTSEKLGERLNVTSRTVKSDMKQLKESVATNEEIQIVSKRSLGYKLMIENQEDEAAIREFFQMYSSLSLDSEFDHRVRYILRRFLSADQPVKVEEIQQELIINYSISRELQKVKEMLAKYGLSLNVRPHHGMVIEGPVFKKIMLTIRMYRYFDKNASNDFGIPEYNAFFYCDRAEKEKIHNTFFKTITNSRIVFSDINAERFIIYLLYFRNQVLNGEEELLDLPKINFDYKPTDEYELVVELVQKLRNKFTGFDFSIEVIQFLTYIAIFSTDLYRFVDCSKENYNHLIQLAEETRNFLLREISEYLQIDAFDDYTCLKDLLKIMIPISLKIMLNVSDSVDLRYKDFHDTGDQPLLRMYMKKIKKTFAMTYQYEFSKREIHLIFLTFCGMLNRIVLEHRKLRLAIIAIDGRLSTQQLKFNLQHNFSEYIERIETKVLYELNSGDTQEYDYYLCSTYGKNLNITHQPIYYVKDELSEFEYIDSLRTIFFSAFAYESKLPPIDFQKVSGKKNGLIKKTDDVLVVDKEIQLKIYLKLTATKQEFTIFEETPTVFTLQIGVSIKEDRQKLKMLLNVLNRIIAEPQVLVNAVQQEQISYESFLR
uniref:BglG family transcription antiterminator n=1 Tax=Candidatus Enterococcus willemsii TaxID=1857215 RepID=UPI00403F1011